MNFETGYSDSDGSESANLSGMKDSNNNSGVLCVLSSEEVSIGSENGSSEESDYEKGPDCGRGRRQGRGCGCRRGRGQRWGCGRGQGYVQHLLQ